jgi:MarR family 2-MHQ and catechol resistance regulon transcriptional repressor
MTAVETTSQILEGSKLSLKLFRVMMRATKAIQTHAAEHINSCQLCPSDFMILEALLHKGSLPTCQIGSKILLTLTNGSITAAVDRLEQRGLVQRIAHETDRRLKLVALTEKGTNLISETFETHEALIDRVTAGLSDEEKRLFIKLARKLGKFADSVSP